MGGRPAGCKLKEEVLNPHPSVSFRVMPPLVAAAPGVTAEGWPWSRTVDLNKHLPSPREGWRWDGIEVRNRSATRGPRKYVAIR